MLVALLLLSVLANATPPELGSGASRIDLASTTRYLEDPTGALTLAEVAAAHAVWQPLPKKDSDFGFTSSAYWLSVSLVNSEPASLARLLEVGYPLLDRVSMYALNAQGDLLTHYETGDLQPFADRPLAHLNFILPIDIPADEELRVYLRIQSSGAVRAPLTLWEPSALQEAATSQLVVICLYVGAMLGLLVYNFFIFLSTRSSAFAYYVLFMAAIVLSVLTIEGFGFRFLWPNSIWWQTFGMAFAAHGIALFGALFSCAFLNVRRHSPLLHYALLSCALLAALSAALIPLLPLAISLKAGIWISVVTMVLALHVALYLLWKGERAARFYLASQACLMAVMMLWSLAFLGALPGLSISEFAVPLGSTLEALLLSFGLANRINQSRLEKEKAERERALAQKEREAAEAAMQAKEAFVANMSHEMRTPLNAITGFTELLLDAPTSPQQRNHLLNIKAGARHLLYVISDVLDLSRLEAGQLQLHEVSFSLDELLREIGQFFVQPLTQKPLELVLYRLPQVPDQLWGDRLRLKQVLLNLVANAVKFTDQGEIELQVRVQPLEEEEHLLFTVRDTGIGIKPGQEARLFKAFSQADESIARKYGGTGLGLNICARLVTLMGGRIGVQSDWGRGSVFHFTIPLVQSDEPHSAEPAPANVRLMAVSAHPLVRRFLTEALDGADCRLQLLELDDLQRATAAEVVLLDLPPERQAVAIDAVRRQLPRARLVVASYSDQASELGLTSADRIITKPLSRQSLIEALGEQAHTQLDPVVSLAGVRVLLVEDTLLNQSFMIELLEAADVVVVPAASGKEALEALAAGSFDAALVDIQMPGMSGYELAQRIRADGRHAQLPLIALTAETLPETRERCLAAGMVAYLTKPLTRGQLYAALAEHARPERISMSQAQPAAEPFDLQASIRDIGGSRQLFLGLLDDFCRDHGASVEELRAAIRQQDRAKLHQLAHVMTGLAKIFSAHELAAAAGAVETALRIGPEDVLVERLARFELALSAMVDAATRTTMRAAG